LSGLALTEDNLGSVARAPREFRITVASLWFGRSATRIRSSTTSFSIATPTR
jgi:hypothetical protein